MKKQVYTKAEWKKIERLAGEKGTSLTKEQAEEFVREIAREVV